MARQPGLRVCALGGPALSDAGAQQLFQLTDLAVVGLVEVLKHYGTFKKLMQAVVQWVCEHRPKVVLLVDYPGFNLRLAEALRVAGVSVKGSGQTQVLMYIGPQIWAWKRHRRFKMAEVLDGLGVIFPFEVDLYQDTSLEVAFVGHPFVEPAHRPPVVFAEAGPVLLLPGSRKQAVQRIFPDLLKAYERYRAEVCQPRQAVTLYPDTAIREVLEAQLEQTPVPGLSLLPIGAGPPQAASAALMSSGTMSLEVALQGIPGAITYRAHPLTWWIGQRVAQVPWLGISNLLLQQDRAQPEALAGALRQAAHGPHYREQAHAEARQLRALLHASGAEASGPGVAPSVAWLLESLC